MMPRLTSGWPSSASGVGDAEVPGHRDLEPAAERGAVNRHHDRLRAVFDARQQRVQVARRVAIAPCGALEAVDVGAGDERLPGAHEHDRRHRGVALGGVEGVDDGRRARRGSAR